MNDNARPIIRPGEMPEGRRDRIEVLLGEARILGTMEDTFEYHGVRFAAAGVTVAPALDVERLARALDSGIALGQPWTSETVTYRTFLIQCAAAIAREYAALAMGDKP